MSKSENSPVRSIFAKFAIGQKLIVDRRVNLASFTLSSSHKRAARSQAPAKQIGNLGDLVGDSETEKATTSTRMRERIASQTRRSKKKFTFGLNGTQAALSDTSFFCFDVSNVFSFRPADYPIKALHLPAPRKRST
jgi:hypothetical protein